jgi:hypothetical protein
MTGTTAQIYDKGTHLVANHRIDYDLLKKIKTIQKSLKLKEPTWEVVLQSVFLKSHQAKFKVEKNSSN